jgi:hypothetical protein
VSDLRSTAAALIANPLVPVPPLEGVVARARRYRAARLRRQMVASLVVAALMTTAVTQFLTTRHTDALRVVGHPVPDESSAGVHFEGPLTTVAPDLAQLVPWSGQNFDGDWSRLPSRRTGCPMRVNGKLAPIGILAKDIGLPAQAPDEQRPYQQVERLIDVYNNFLGGICGRAMKLIEGSLEKSWAKDAVAVIGMPLDDGFATEIVESVSCTRSGHRLLP